MKKLFVIFGIFAVAAMLWAENQTTSCESEYGTCFFELSDKALLTKCACYDERNFESTEAFPEDGSFTYTLPTEEWCQKKIESLCKISVHCSNDGGSCYLEKNDDYSCYCLGVGEKKTGKSSYFGEEGCNKLLVETCGSESPTLRKVCPEGILNECVSYFERIHNTCLDPIDIDEILDTPITYGPVTVHEFADCCRSEYWRNEYKREYDCMERFKTCADKECCVCTIQGDCGDSSEEDCYDFIEYPDSEEEDVDVDVDVDNVDKTNAEASTTAATPENTADGDSTRPATDSEAPAEDKERSKSDGCSMLFV